MSDGMRRRGRVGRAMSRTARYGAGLFGNVEKTMIDVDVDVLNQCWQDLRETLKDGLLSGDVWARGSGVSMSGYRADPKVTALLDRLIGTLSGTLAGSGFPGLDRYCLLRLTDGHVLVILRHDDRLLQGFVLDSKKVNMGILMSVAIPRALTTVSGAIRN